VLVPSPGPRPLVGLELFDAAGDRVADLDADGSRPPGAGFWMRLPLEPGAYFLRHTNPDGTAVEWSLVASPDWLTEVTLGPAPDGSVEDVAVFMRPTGGGPKGPDQDAVIEAARIALAQGRNLFGDGHGARARRLLLAEYLDPVAGIVGAHLLLRAGETGATFDAVVRRLRGFVGWTHPDVEALSLRCTDPGLRGTDPVAVPPMFRASWDLVVAASYERPGLVPGPLWDRVRAATTLGPFLAWAADDTTRDAHAALLGDWVTRVAPDADAARRMGVPAGALTAAGSLAQPSAG
jgi:hypothetical protein